MSKEGKLSPEIRELEAKYKKDPNGKIFAPLAEAYRKNGMVEKAIAITLAGIKKYPNYMNGHIVLGKCYHDSQKYKEAIKEFEKVLELYPENMVALRKLGDIYKDLGQIGKAIEYYKQIIEIEPLNTSVRGLLDELRDDVERYETESTVAMDTSTLADIYIKQGFYDKALQIYENILKTDPHNLDIQNKIDELKKKINPESDEPSFDSIFSDLENELTESDAMVNKGESFDVEQFGDIFDDNSDSNDDKSSKEDLFKSLGAEKVDDDLDIDSIFDNLVDTEEKAEDTQVEQEELPELGEDAFEMDDELPELDESAFEMDEKDDDLNSITIDEKDNEDELNIDDMFDNLVSDDETDDSTAVNKTEEELPELSEDAFEIETEEELPELDENAFQIEDNENEFGEISFDEKETEDIFQMEEEITDSNEIDLDFSETDDSIDEDEEYTNLVDDAFEVIDEDETDLQIEETMEINAYNQEEESDNKLKFEQDDISDAFTRTFGDDLSDDSVVNKGDLVEDENLPELDEAAILEMEAEEEVEIDESSLDDSLNIDDLDLSLEEETNISDDSDISYEDIDKTLSNTEEELTEEKIETESEVISENAAAELSETAAVTEDNKKEVIEEKAIEEKVEKDEPKIVVEADSTIKYSDLEDILLSDPSFGKNVFVILGNLLKNIDVDVFIKAIFKKLAFRKRDKITDITIGELIDIFSEAVEPARVEMEKKIIEKRNEELPEVDTDSDFYKNNLANFKSWFNKLG